MGKKIMALIGMGAMALSMYADIVVNVSKEITDTEFNCESSSISNLLLPRRERMSPKTETLKVESGKFVIKTGESEKVPMRYVVYTDETHAVILYTEKGENLELNLMSKDPLRYSVKGSRMMEDISALDEELYQHELRSGDVMLEKGDIEGNRAKLDSIAREYDVIRHKFIEKNPTSPAVAYAILSLGEPEDLVREYNKMTPEAKESILMPMLDLTKEYVERRIESDRRIAAMSDGTKDAPDFTFNDKDGKAVSLRDFRGKWVVIDFWGTWCPWCIKGFPALKEAYSKYSGKMEVIGVACNDTKEKWLAGLEKYQLPWVNVFNPETENSKVLTDYAIEGFPTKVVVSPEGKIANITVGEDPEFFDKLAEFLK